MKTSNALSRLAGSDSESDSVIQQSRKPSGGLLSRLHPRQDDSSEDDAEGDSDAAYERTVQRFTNAKAASVLSSDNEDDESSGEDAYERMKKQLAAGATEQQPDTEMAEQSNPKTKPAAAVSSDEEDAPVRPTAARRVRHTKENMSSAPPSPSSARSRRSSPGLFVTPDPSPVKTRTRSPNTIDDDSDQPTKPVYNADFNERVKRIRAERLAQKNQEKQNRAKKARQSNEEESESSSDGENGTRLTQQSKPTRKAGKKAMEAMVRDQQRIVRSMQLTHQSKTKKKFGTKDLLAKFGFPVDNDTSVLPTPDASSQPTSPDAETDQAHATSTVAPIDQTDASTTLPISSTLDKGKGRAPEFQHLPAKTTPMHSEQVTAQNVEVASEVGVSAGGMVELSDSEDDLVVVQPKSRLAVFDKVPQRKAQEPASLLHLRHLAQVNSGHNVGPKGQRMMNNVEFQLSLQQKARLQNRNAREERLAELRAKGVYILTEEEKEKAEAVVENMLEKAQENERALAKKERQERRADGETGDGLVSSDEEDMDYVGSEEEDAAEGADDEDEDEMELVLSGSEDEAEDDEEMSEKPHGLFDDVAEEDNEEAVDETANNLQLGDEDEDDEEAVVTAPSRRPANKRAKHVIVDDEDEDHDEKAPAGSPTQQATQKDDPLAAFGFVNAAPALGLTQAFAGTMASLDADSQNQPTIPEQDSIDFLRSIPDTQPLFNSSQATIPNSQPETSQGESYPPIDMGISQVFQAEPEFSATQLSEVPEPTQDAGFLLSRSPAGFAGIPSTVDTVMMAVEESPIKERKGKLRRRAAESPVELSDVDEDLDATELGLDEGSSVRKAKDVFSVMKKAAKKQRKVEDFNKQTSWAKDIVQEQAEESEDEYAGLGGASDDDSGNEMEQELKDMIDTSEIKVDKSKHEQLWK